MSSSEEEEDGDNLSDIDFSVISASIKVGGTMLNQIVNSVNYGSPEVRYLLQEECDLIIECKVCRNFFRSIPLFVAHKRIYCREFSASGQDIKARETAAEEETIVVQPQSIEDSGNKEDQVQKSTIDKLKEGTFHGTSGAYRFYTETAQRIENQRASKALSTITVTEIPSNPNAVMINVEKSVVNQSEDNIVNQSENLLQNDPVTVDSERLNEKKDDENNIVAGKHSSELMKMLTKENENVPEELVDNDKNSEQVKSVITVVETKKGKNVPKTMELRPVKSQDATITELKEIATLGHCDAVKLKCLLCRYVFKSRKSLLQHMHCLHSGKKTIYPCTLCSKKFQYFWGLTRHLKRNHNKSQQQVDKMRKYLREKSYTISLDDNMNGDSENINERKSDVTVPVEAATVSSNKSLSEISERVKKSVRTPGGINLNKCEGCGKVFWKRQSYDEHTLQCKWFPPSKDAKNNSRSRTVIRNDVNDEVETIATRRYVNTRSESIERKGSNRSEKGSVGNENGDGTTTRSRESSGSRNTVRDMDITTRGETRLSRGSVKNNVTDAQGTSRSKSRDSARSTSRDRMSNSKSENEKKDETVSTGVKSVETQMVTRNFATRRGEFEKKGIKSKSVSDINKKVPVSENNSKEGKGRNEIESNMAARNISTRSSDVSDKSSQDQKAESSSPSNIKTLNHLEKESMVTVGSVANTRKIGTRSSTVSSTDEVDGSDTLITPVSTRSSRRDTDKISPSSKSSASSHISNSSRNVAKDGIPTPVSSPKKYVNTRTAISPSNRDSKTSSRNSSLEREVPGSPKKHMNTRSSENQVDKELENSQTNKISPTRHSSSRSTSREREVTPIYGTRSSSKDKKAEMRPISNFQEKVSDFLKTADSKRQRVNSESSVSSSGFVDKKWTSRKHETNSSFGDEEQPSKKPESVLEGAGNTYIIDGVEISEVTEDQMNARTLDNQDQIDHIDSEALSSELANTDIEVGIIRNNPSSLRNLQKPAEKVVRHIGSVETRSSSNERKEHEISTPTGKTPGSGSRVPSSERKTKLHTSISPKNTTGSRSLSENKDKERRDNVGGNLDNGNSVVKKSPILTRTKESQLQLLRSKVKGRQERQSAEKKASVEEGVTNNNNSLQNFPDLQMLTRKSLEKICPKEDDDTENKGINSPDEEKKHTDEMSSKKSLSENEGLSDVQLDSGEHLKTVYPCIFCSSEFSYYWGLSRHLKINHRISKLQIGILWPKVKAKSYTTNALKRLKKKQPIKKDLGVTKLKRRHGVQTRDKSMKAIGKKIAKTMNTRLRGSMKSGTQSEPVSISDAKNDIKDGGVNAERKELRTTRLSVEKSTAPCSGKSKSNVENIDQKEIKNTKGTIEPDKHKRSPHSSKDEVQKTGGYNTRRNQEQESSDRSFDSMSFKPGSDGQSVTVNPVQEENYLGMEINSNSNKVCIEEIWVGKEPGQPSKSIRCQKVIIESESGKSILSKMTVRRKKTPKSSPEKSWKFKEKGNKKMYVVEPGNVSSQPRCLDSKRVDALISENHNTAEQHCLQCGMAFSNVSNLRRHIVRHLGWKRYKCKLCSFASYNRSECSTHLRRTHAERLIGTSVGNFVIDLNKEASKLRTEKKQITMSLRKRDQGNSNSPRKSYWYRDRNTKNTTLKTTKIVTPESNDTDVKRGINTSEVHRRKRTLHKKNIDRKKPGVKIENIKQPSSTKYNISTRNSMRTFDTSPYKMIDKMETLMTRQGYYPKDEKIILRSKRDILSDIDNEEVLPITNLETKALKDPVDQSNSDIVHGTSKELESHEQMKERPVVRKRKRSDSEGNSPVENVKGQGLKVQSTSKTSPGSKAKKVPKETDQKWKLKRSMSHDGIPSSQVSNQDNMDTDEAVMDDQADVASLHDDHLEDRYTELRHDETDVRPVPSLKTMMAALEEARASVKKRGRMSIKRSISPVKKIQRVGSYDLNKDRLRRHSVDVGQSSKADSSASRLSLDSKIVVGNFNDDDKHSDNSGAITDVTDNGRNDHDTEYTKEDKNSNIDDKLDNSESVISGENVQNKEDEQLSSSLLKSDESDENKQIQLKSAESNNEDNSESDITDPIKNIENSPAANS